MKKFTSLALTGALALGALAGVTAFDAKPAAAASVQATSTAWNDPGSLMDLSNYAWDFPAYLSDDVQSAYKTGDYFTVRMGWYNALDGNPMKVYRVMDNKSLVRYQTIYPVPVFNGTSTEAVWQASITSAYEPGSYIAVVNIDGNFYKSKIFNINK